MAIPSRIIEGIYAKELKAEDYYEIYGKDAIEKALEEISASNIQILNKYKAEDMRAAIEAKLSGTKKTSSVKVFRIASFAAAAVFVAAVALPVSLNTMKSRTSQPSIRTKGAVIENSSKASLSLYRQKGNEVYSLINGSSASEGDVIQITYTAGQNDYGIIFSVDGNGNITNHFPINSWTAEPLKHGTDEVPLDYSYELDNAPDFECFIMVSSKQQFSLDDLSNKIKNKKDIEYLKKCEYLPKKTEAVSFVLEK